MFEVVSVTAITALGSPITSRSRLEAVTSSLQQNLLSVLICRILLIFTVFGLNGFLHFLPMQLPEGPAGQFVGAMAQTHYVVVVFLVQLIGGVLLLADRYVPLALAILGPVVVNILLFHICMAPAGLPAALITAALWFVVFAGVRRAFSGIFLQKVGP